MARLRPWSFVRGCCSRSPWSHAAARLSTAHAHQKMVGPRGPAWRPRDRSRRFYRNARPDLSQSRVATAARAGMARLDFTRLGVGAATLLPTASTARATARAPIGRARDRAGRPPARTRAASDRPRPARRNSTRKLLARAAARLSGPVDVGSVGACPGIVRLDEVPAVRRADRRRVRDDFVGSPRDGDRQTGYGQVSADMTVRGAPGG